MKDYIPFYHLTMSNKKIAHSNFWNRVVLLLCLKNFRTPIAKCWFKLNTHEQYSVPVFSLILIALAMLSGADSAPSTFSKSSSTQKYLCEVFYLDYRQNSFSPLVCLCFHNMNIWPYPDWHSPLRKNLSQ